MRHVPGDALTKDGLASDLEGRQELGLVQTVQAPYHRRELGIRLPDGIKSGQVVVQATAYDILFPTLLFHAFICIKHFIKQRG